MADKQYGVIHEIGDYSQFQSLNEEDNKTINEQVNSENEKK